MYFTTWLLRILFLFFPWQSRWIFSSGTRGGLPWEWNTVAVTMVEVVLWAAVLLSPLVPTPCGSGSRLYVGTKRGSEGSYPKASSNSPHPSLFKGGRRSLFVFTSLALLIFVVPRSTPISLLHALDAILLVIILRRHPNPRQFIPYFIAGMIPAALLGLWQFWTQTTFSSTLLGLASHPVWQGGTSVVEAVGGRWLRAYGPFPHPNIFGGYLAVALVLGVSRRDWTRFAAPLFASVLVLTFSRSAWLAAGVGILCVYVIPSCPDAPRVRIPTLRRDKEGIEGSYPHQNNSLLPPSFQEGGKGDRFFFRSNSPQPSLFKGGGRDCFVSLAMTTLATLITISFVLPLIAARATAIGRLENKSISERSAAWQRATDDIRAHPFLGVGLGHGADQGEPVHNAFALVLVETGLVGVFLVVLLLGVAGVSLRSLRTRTYVRYSSVSLIATLLILALFDHYLWSLLPGLLLAAAGIGWMNSSPD